MNDVQWAAFKEKRAKSSFRLRFHLSEKDKEYVRTKGMEKIESHAYDFIRKRLAPAAPANDGKQTPMKGHPVFIAQHALGCCCRSCLEKWHHVPKGRELREDEIEEIVSIIMRWISEEINRNQ